MRSHTMFFQRVLPPKLFPAQTTLEVTHVRVLRKVLLIVADIRVAFVAVRALVAVLLAVLDQNVSTEVGSVVGGFAAVAALVLSRGWL